MSTELTVLQPSGGLGINPQSHFFQIKPVTLAINQPTTTAEGAIKGKLRDTKSGEQFDKMRVVFIDFPVERRSYYIGERGSNRTAENLMCFAEVTRDKFKKELQGPSDKAKVPQAIKCSSCDKQSWDAWRENKVPENLPPCDVFYIGTFVDVTTLLPYRMYVQSKNKDTFEEGLETLVRKLFVGRPDGQRPNVFDWSFVLGTRPVQGKKTTTYQLTITGFEETTKEDREKLTAIYHMLSREPEAPTEQQQAEAKVDDTRASINTAVAGITEDVQDAEIVV